MKPRFKLQPVLVALTLVNLATLGVLISRPQAVASPAPTDGVLRGRGLQIVDDAGKVRASIAIMSATKQADGSTFPETVLLRLITSEGRPAVKLSSSDDGAGMSLTAGTGPAYAQITARGDNPKFVIIDGSGKQTSQLP